MYADTSSSKGPGGSAPGLGSGNSSYLRNLGLPTQLCLLVADVAVCINFVVALLVPWVEAKLKVANFWFPVYVPVKVRSFVLIRSMGLTADNGFWSNRHDA